MDNNKIFEKVKMKIAISNVKEEDIVMNKNRINIGKKIGIAACIVMTLSGVVYAGNKVIENVWKTPNKVENLTHEITEENKKENISEEQAKELAIKKLNSIGFNSNIVKTNHYKEYDSDKICYRFEAEDKYEISIDGQTGEFSRISYNGNNQDTSKYMTEEQAKELANKYYKLFGYEEGEYEITKIQSINNEGSGTGSGFTMTVIYNKKYGDVYNPFEYIWITVESKNMGLDSFTVGNIPFDNNEVVITESEAIDIAIKEDEKIETNEIENTKTKLMVVKMNADAYDRINDKDKHYEAMQTPNYPSEERNYYNVEDRVRLAWVVVINYVDNYGDDIVKRYTEGKYSYFVDATTGEIIGGHTLDYIYSESR